jgi:hypothetical protein
LTALISDTVSIHGGLNQDSSSRSINKLITNIALGFGVLLSGFVVFEPAPYELYMVVLIGVWFFLGLRLTKNTTPLLGIFVVFIIGALVSMMQMPNLKTAPLYISVSGFLALTTVFYASIIERDGTLLAVIFNNYLVAAICTSLLGILAYFHLIPGSDLFIKYNRASGGFQDPNVFGPFLILPSSFLLLRAFESRPLKMLTCFFGLIILALGVFLSFSRAAWGMLGMIAVFVSFFLFVSSNSNRFRFRIMLTVSLSLLVIALTLLIVLQIPQVAVLFNERAKLVQDYDGERLGRFARYTLGYIISLEHPWGIGPLEFGPIYGEDTHNMWLKALLDYSWIGFSAYIILVFMTLGLGFRIIFRDRPWKPYLICAYSTYMAHLIISNIIDVDHWRHLYMVIGIIWGCVGLEYRHGHAKRAQQNQCVVESLV